MKKLLTIAGSDCSGGAGIQADMKTFSAFRCYSMSVITAVTAQNTLGILDSENISPGLIQKQIKSVFEDLAPDGIKIGMLSDSETIHVVAENLKKYPLPFTVIDPVMISKSGFPLLNPDAIDTLKSELLPLANLITPNIPEAEILCGLKIKSHKDMENAAEMLYKMGASSVLVKGGHLETSSDDLFYDGTAMHWFPGTRVKTKNTHGTGCTLSSAIVALIAQGLLLTEAIKTAKEYVLGAIQNALDIGQGCGPTHHFYQLWNQNKEGEI